MKNKSIKITTFIIICCLLTNVLLFGTYYFTDKLLPAICIGSVLLLFISHILLEKSFGYHACFVFTTINVTLAVMFTACVYFLADRTVFPFCPELLLLPLSYWIIPVIYCIIRDLLDRGPRYIGFAAFFRKSAFVFLFYYIVFLILTLLIFPADLYKFITDSKDYVPFYTFVSFLGSNSSNWESLYPVILHVIKYIICFIPLGFFLSMFLRHRSGVTRLFCLFLGALAPELLQLASGRGFFDLDDAVFAFLGCLIGYFIYSIINSIYYYVNGNEFLHDRSGYAFYRKLY